MAEIIIMPKLGFNMSEGKLVKWNKKEGEYIEKGEDFFEIETDKTTMSIEATTSGTILRILVQDGSTVPVTTPIAIVGEAGEDINKIVQDLKVDNSKEPKEDTVQKISVPSERTGTVGAVKDESRNIKVTPRGQKYLRDNNIDTEILNVIKGTGFENGISEKDIKCYLKNNRISATPLARKLAQMKGIRLEEVEGTGYKGKVLKSDVVSSVEKEATIKDDYRVDRALSHDNEILREIPYQGVRRVIGERLSSSMQTSPHVYFTISVDTTNLEKIRKEINSSQPEKVSFTDLIVVAVRNALQKYPMINASLVEDSIIQHSSINVGIAVAADTGLIVPVIKNVQDKKILDVAKESKELIQKAKDNKLLPDEYSGGTFTISNLGMFNIDTFTAIINPPESAILAVSSTRKKPVVVTENGEDRLVIKPIMKITLSVDHRIIDGLLATQFINEVKDNLENPISMLIK